MMKTIALSLFYLKQLRRDLKATAEDLKEKQNRKLRAIVRHAYENVPFYHRKFRAAGILPSNILSVEDLVKIPLTTKLEIQAAPLGDLIARGADWKHFVKRETSGSTGIPLNVIVDNNVVDYENALWGLAFFGNGMKPWHRMVRITDPRNFPASRRLHECLGLMRTDFVSVFDGVESQLSVIEEKKPDVVRGYTTCVENLARFGSDRLARIKPSMVFTSAELLDKRARDTINAAFRTELFDLYVCVEFGLVAWECREHSGYHINTDSLVVEFVKNSEVASFGERGEIVCTGLINKTMPLIRYDLGDVAVPSTERCKCGISLPLMKIVEGRRGDYLIATNGRMIPPIIFFPFPFDEVSGIRQFRVIQEKKDELVVEMVIREWGSTELKENLEKAEKNLKHVFGEDMRVDFNIVDKIERDPTGKLRKIVSHLPTGNDEKDLLHKQSNKS